MSGKVSKRLRRMAKEVYSSAELPITKYIKTKEGVKRATNHLGEVVSVPTATLQLVECQRAVYRDIKKYHKQGLLGE